jgi:cation transport ATPase
VALTGRLVVRADKIGKDTQLSQLIRLVEQAQRLAALGFLNPVIASVAMTLSSAFVVAGSLRLQRHRIRAAPGKGTSARSRQAA